MIEPVPMFAATRPAFGALAGALLCAALLAGCGLGVSSEERLARAQQSFDAGDYRAAVIDTRNVLQKESENAAARLLLGRASIRLGDSETAEKELRRALALGVPAEDVAIDLARALLLQGKFRQLIDEADPEAQSDPAARQALLRLVGDAHLGAGAAAQAREAYSAALAIDDADREAKLGIVRSYVAERNLLQARATLTEVLQAEDDYAQAWILSGQLHQQAGQQAAARGDFERARAIAAREGQLLAELQALTGLAEASLAVRDIEAARGYAADLQALAAGSISSLRLAARIAFIDDDLELAQQKLLELLRRSPNDADSRLMLGAIHLQNGNLGQADMYLSALVADQPDHSEARRLLAQTRLQLDKLGEAADLLRPVVGDPDADTRSLELAARVSLESGDLDAATDYLERNTQANPENSEAQLNLAIAYLMAGRLDDVQDVLDKVDVSDSDESGFRRDLIAVLTSMRRDLTTAPDKAVALREKWPDRAAAHSLHGMLLLGQEQLGAARAAFDAARQVEPGDISSLRYLGRIDEAEGKLDAADRRYRELLDLKADDIDAMISLARLGARDGDPQAAIDWLQKAREADAAALAPRVLLGKLYVTGGRHGEALEVMSEALAIDAADAEVHNVTGLAQLGSGDTAAALEEFRQAVDLDPDRPEFRLNLARAYAAGGQEASALETLEGADDGLEHLPSGITLAQLRARQGDLVGALKITEQLRRLHPSSAVPVMLAAEFNVQRGALDEAVELYDAALALDGNSRIVARSYAVRKLAGVSRPEALLLDHLEKQPDDVTILLALAAHHQEAAEPGAAVKVYERVLEVAPKNFIAANNLAWMYFESDDPRAEEMARLAYTLAPDNGSVVDTLGWILVRDNRLDEGLPLLRKAVELDPRPEIEYHLAAALALSGGRSEARDILERILADDAAFSSRNEAENLLASL